MADPNEELAGRIRHGRLVEFLHRDVFAVRLNDGVTISAVMPEELFSVYHAATPLNRVTYPEVTVEMRDPPALPKIIEASRSSFCGPGY